MVKQSWSENTVGVQTVPEISPMGLATMLEAGSPIQILDVRAQSSETRIAAGLIPQEKVVTIIGSRLLQISDLAGTGIDPEKPVIVLCGHGNDSKVVARHLNQIGAKARSLTGGMSAWMRVSLPRILRPPASLDRLVQFDRIGKEALSYVLVSDGQALLIDAPRDFSAHLQCIVETGATLIGVANTHVHADYISGGSDISHRLGIPYYLHTADSVSPYDGRPGRMDFTPLEDGMVLHIGRCDLIVDHTPGHSPGSVSFRIDHQAAFTGDFLFLTSIGRPDLAERTEEWASQLWRSLQRAKQTWSKRLTVYPAHYATATVRTREGGIAAPFSRLLSENPALRDMREQEFLRWITGKTTTAPPAYRTIKGINIGLVTVDDQQADTLENGKNQCAVQ